MAEWTSESLVFIAEGEVPLMCRVSYELVQTTSSKKRSINDQQSGGDSHMAQEYFWTLYLHPSCNSHLGMYSLHVVGKKEMEVLERISS